MFIQESFFGLFTYRWKILNYILANIIFIQVLCFLYNIVNCYSECRKGDKGNRHFERAEYIRQKGLQMKRVVRKSLALLLAVSVFASTIDSRAYAAEVKVESTMESTAVEETIEKESETLREESVEGVLTECETESVTVVYTEEVTIEEASVIEGETTVESATDEIETSEDGSGVAETKVTEGEEITTEDCETDMSASDETTTEVFSSEEIWAEEPLTDETLVEEDTMVENITVESTTEEVTEEDAASTEESTEESVYEADNFSVVFKLDSAWDGGYNASVRIENAGDEVIHDWHLR